jgi:hypothetical protein
MGDILAGRSVMAALLLLCPTLASADPMLRVATANGVIAAIPMPDGAEICLHWAHSVTGGAVADCFANRAGRLVLDRAYLHDFAAGLGEVVGRGTLTPAPEGGYWIIGINETLPDNRLTLRIGPPRVGHRLDWAGGSVALSDIAPNRRADLHLFPTP